jgi:hypothetical protein
MQKIADLFGNRTAPPKQRRRSSERGDLLEEFLIDLLKEWDAEKYGKLTIQRLSWKLTGIPTRDLYALRSKCNDAKRRGYSFAKTFFWEIKSKENAADDS